METMPGSSRWRLCYCWMSSRDRFPMVVTGIVSMERVGEEIMVYGESVAIVR
jgi:hypothetical protein